MGKKRCFDKGTESILSGMDPKSIEKGGLKNVVTNLVCRDIGLEGFRVWKKGKGSYYLADTWGGEEMKGMKIPDSHPHIQRLRREEIVRNTRENHTKVEEKLGVGDHYIEVAAGIDLDYVLVFDLKRDPKLERLQRDTTRSVGWNITRAIEKNRERGMREKEMNKNRRYRKNLKAALNDAREVQMSILPSEQPKVEGYDIYGNCMTAYELGGDYYDFIKLPDGSTEIAIADVSGKGVSAALVTRSVHTNLDMMAELGMGLNLEYKMSKINNYIYKHSKPDQFITMILGRLKGDDFEYINAGHENPILFNDRGAKETGDSNLVLGAVGEMSYDKNSVNMEKGDIMLLYTDGIIEAVKPGNNSDNFFGTERLKEMVLDNRKLTSEKIGENIIRELKPYKCKSYMDDRTMIILKKNY